jgi:pimeloyl-ACP methyl ester carboxylesterase
MTGPTTVELRRGPLRFTACARGEGPLVVLLHGFPDHPVSFRHQLPALAGAGFRAVAPFLRGYEPTSQPARRDYGVGSLAADVVAWLDHLEVDRAHLVGHDWGAIVAYATAAVAPERVRSVVGMAVPPFGRRPTVNAALAVRQMRRSWYMAWLQVPRLAERSLRSGDGRLLRRLWSDWSPGYRPGDAEWAELLATMSAPGVIDAAVSYYRTNLRRPGRLLRLMRPGPVPVLALTGADDGCVDTRIYDTLRPDDFPGGLTVERVAGAGHWLHLERPAHVNGLLIDWLRGDGQAAAG